MLLEKLKTQMKEILCSQTGKLNTVRVAILLKQTYRSNIIFMVSTCKRMLFGQKNEVLIFATRWMNLKKHYSNLNKIE